MLLSYDAFTQAFHARRFLSAIFRIISAVAMHIDSPSPTPARASFLAPARIAPSPASVQQPLQFPLAFRCSTYLLNLGSRYVGLKPFPAEQATLLEHRAASNDTTRVARFC